MTSKTKPSKWAWVYVVWSFVALVFAIVCGIEWVIGNDPNDGVRFILFLVVAHWASQDAMDMREDS